MIYLDNLDREHIKFKNVYAGIGDNSTWSLDGSTKNPPRVVVGSNAHKVTVFDLQTCLKSQIDAHQHNVPCVTFSPCGKFIASTSIDKSVKIWAEVPPEFLESSSENAMKTNSEETTPKEYFLVKVAYPSKDWGWALQWVDKNHISIELSIHEQLENKNLTSRLDQSRVSELDESSSLKR